MPYDQIRKQWLTLFLISPVLSLLSFVLTMSANPEWTQLPSSFRNVFYFASAATWLVIYYTMYHCCYKKRGTKLLLFMLIITIPSVAHSIYIHWSGLIPAYLIQMAYYKPLYILGCGFSVLWAFLNFRLWQANKEWRRGLS